MRALVRPMEAADLPRVAANEKAASAYPWRSSQFEQALGKHCCWVVQTPQGIQGHAVFSVVLEEAELFIVAIHPASQGQGLARLLLNRCLADLKEQHQVERVYLEVRESNHPARTLYQNLGFEENGLRKNYYPAASGRENALLMGKTL